MSRWAWCARDFASVFGSSTSVRTLSLVALSRPDFAERLGDVALDLCRTLFPVPGAEIHGCLPAVVSACVQWLNLSAIHD
jgi:hypothetical protein